MAQMPFSPCDPNNGACTDESVKMLQHIFGDVVTALTTGVDPNTVNMGGNVLATMFSTFNSGIWIIASLVVSYVALMGVANTANDGEAMGKGWSSLWTPVRIVAGGSVLLPTTSGYSFIQLIVMLFALWGVGFANTCYKAGIAMGILSPNGIVQGVNAPGNYYGLREFGKQYVAASYCARSANGIYVDSSGGGNNPAVGASGSGGASTPDRQTQTNGRTDSTFYIKDRNSSTNLAGGQPFCGTVNISSYAAQPMSDPTAAAMEQIHAAVQTKKIAAVTGMMQAIDRWVSTWPSDINQSGWDQINSDDFNTIIKTYEDQIATGIVTSVSSNQSGVDSGVAAFTNTLTADGWASAGGWFQRVGLIRGQIGNILSAPVGSVTAPSLSSLPSDTRASLLSNSVTTITEAITKKAEEKPSYSNSVTPKPEDMASFIPKDASSDINPGAIKSNMDAKMSSFVNNTMLNVVQIATGTGSNGQTPLCGSAGQMGGSLNRMKCIGDYLAVAKMGIVLADVAIKTGATALRVIAGGMSGVKIVGTGVELDKVVTPLWDWIIEVPIKQLAMLAAYIEPLAFYFGVFLPSLPYTIFMIVVVGWILAVLQSVVAAPLWAVMHMTPDKTFIGSQTQGYLLLLSLFTRPALAVIGLFSAVLVADPIIDYIARGFFSMRGAVVSSTGGVGAIAEFLTFAWWLIVFGLTLLPVLYMIYGLPQVLPDHVLRWIGGGLGDLGETNAIGQMRGGMAAAGAGASTPKLGGGGGSNLQLGSNNGMLGGGTSPALGSSQRGGSAPVSANPQGITPGLSGASGDEKGASSEQALSPSTASDGRRVRDKIGEAAGVAIGRAVTGLASTAGKAAARTGNTVMSAGRQGVESYQSSRGQGESLAQSVKSGATSAAIVGAEGLVSAASEAKSDIAKSAKTALSEGKLAYREGAKSRIDAFRSEVKGGGSQTMSTGTSAPSGSSLNEDLPDNTIRNTEMSSGGNPVSDPGKDDEGAILRQEVPPTGGD